MKNENLIYLIGTVMLLSGAAMRILDLPFAEYGELITNIAILGITIFLIYKNLKLKKKIKEFES